MTKITPRGIRNNNPLNIRIGNNWQGEVEIPTDNEFEQFKKIEYGIRAGFIILRRYINHYKRNTVPEIIKAWAPSNENNTVAYTKSVLQSTGLHYTDIINFNDVNTMCSLVSAMIKVECGVTLDKEVILRGYELAVNL